MANTLVQIRSGSPVYPVTNWILIAQLLIRGMNDSVNAQAGNITFPVKKRSEALRFVPTQDRCMLLKYRKIKFDTSG